jgi:hypothetical protein
VTPQISRDRCFDFENILAKKLAVFLLKSKLNYAKIWTYVTLVFEENAIFFAENCQNSPKILIITSTPGPGSLNKTLFKNLKNPYLS